MARDASDLPTHRDDRARLARGGVARDRIDAELAALPVWGSAAFASWLAQHDLSTDLSPGVLVHLLRRATAEDDLVLAQTLFIAILRRSERHNTAWARRTAAHTVLPAPMRESLREDLKQELTLSLWQRLPAMLLSALAARSGPCDEPPGEPIEADTPSPADPFTAADLADLRDLVAQLPYRERVSVVMRFWLGASEHDIAAALGVTARTVRNLLARAYGQLRREYEGGPDQRAHRPFLPVAPERTGCDGSGAVGRQV